ncbi:MAG: hypothetical protein H7X89_10335 [Rhizobiales bacterium]|nr:hypothetical protein [Hyphomicrobiales bacterium]
MAGVVLALAFVSAAQAEWVEGNVPEFGFSALFPKAPEKGETIEDGVKITSFSGAADGKFCIVVAGDYPFVINPDEETVASRDNFAKGVNAKVTTSQRITFPRGLTDLQAIKFDAESDTHTFRSLIVIDGSRAYQVAAGMSKPVSDGTDLDTCIGGFKLTPKT